MDELPKLPIRPDTLVDRVHGYYLGNFDLTPDEKKICERWETIYSLMVTHKIKAKVVKQVEELYPGLSRPQIYRDIRNAEQIFSPIRSHSKDFLRMLVIEQAMAEIDECDAKIKKLEEENDGKTLSVTKWEMIKRVRDRALKTIIEAGGLKLNDPALPDPSKIQQHQFTIELPPDMINLIEGLLSKGVVDISAIFNQNSEDAAILPNEDIQED